MNRLLRELDRLLAFLMRPRVRRVRRWSFVLTVPAAALFASVIGLQGGALVLALRFFLWLVVAVTAWRLGGERGEAVRDLVMHPRVRALLRTEVDVVLAVPWLVLRRRTVPAALRYSRGDFGPAIALALTPAMLVEAGIVHLLVPSGWLAVHVASAVAHAYALVWLLGWGFGSRAYPHKIVKAGLHVRGGTLYRAQVPLHAITAATPRRERIGGEAGLVVRDGVALLPVRGRVDVWLELDQPVLVQRPLADPVAVRGLALASDAPDELAGLLLAGAAAAGRAHPGGLGALAGLDLADAVHHALQPA
jgi:hypothetical protein